MDLLDAAATAMQENGITCYDTRQTGTRHSDAGPRGVLFLQGRKAPPPRRFAAPRAASPRSASHDTEGFRKEPRLQLTTKP